MKGNRVGGAMLELRLGLLHDHRPILLLRCQYRIRIVPAQSKNMNSHETRKGKCRRTSLPAAPWPSPLRGVHDSCRGQGSDIVLDVSKYASRVRRSLTSYRSLDRTRGNVLLRPVVYICIEHVNSLFSRQWLHAPMLLHYLASCVHEADVCLVVRQAAHKHVFASN